MLNIILFGPPGVGKGTQSKKILERYNLTHLSTGDILRKTVDNYSPQEQKAIRRIDQGNLVPDSIAIDIIDREFQGHRNKIPSYLFDGFPRSTHQAEWLDKNLSERDTSVTCLISLQASDEELINRLLRRGAESGRADDQDVSVIQKRLDIYNHTMKPIAEYYKQQGKFIGIDGMGSIDEVFQRVCSRLDPLTHKQSNTTLTS